MPAILCSSCNHANLQGEDRCEQCLHTLMQRDLPQPKKDDSYQTVMMTAPVSTLVTGKDLLVASKKDTVQKIIDVLREKKKDCVLVYEKKRLVGIVSLRDLLRKATLPGTDLNKITIAQVMTPNPEFVRAEDPIAFMVNKMSMGGYRHVPVLQKDGTPLSIVSIKDVLGYLSKREKTADR